MLLQHKSHLVLGLLLSSYDPCHFLVFLLLERLHAVNQQLDLIRLGRNVCPEFFVQMAHLSKHIVFLLHLACVLLLSLFDLGDLCFNELKYRVLVS